jgi:hypothetical protein
MIARVVRLADLCAYATRRFFENGEEDLFDCNLGRFDQARGKVVGIRHYVGAKPCTCKACAAHRGWDHRRSGSRPAALPKSESLSVPLQGRLGGGRSPGGDVFAARPAQGRLRCRAAFSR